MRARRSFARLVTRKLPHVGVSAIGNANPAASFAGVVLTLLVGTMPFGGRPDQVAR